MTNKAGVKKQSIKLGRELRAGSRKQKSRERDWSDIQRWCRANLLQSNKNFASNCYRIITVRDDDIDILGFIGFLPFDMLSL